MSGAYVTRDDLDQPLVDMVLAAKDAIEAWIDAGGGIFEIDDISWDFPAALPESAGGDVRRDLEAMDLANKASHAIGFICGVAAGLDITPLTLIDLVVRSWPPQQAPKKRTKRQR